MINWRWAISIEYSLYFR